MKIKKSLSKLKQYNPPLEDRASMIRLDFNENTQGCSPKVLQALSSLTSKNIAQYPEYKKAQQLFAKYFKLGKEEVFLTNGCDDAIKLVFETFVESSEEILFATPTFSMFSFYASLIGAKVKEIPYNNDLSFPSEKMLRSISKKTKLVVLVNPNNPTGSAISQKNIIEILKKSRKNNTLVLIDEAYIEFLGKSSLSLLKKYQNLIITRTFSKAYGLAGMRLGCIFSSKQIISTIKRVSSPYAANSIAVRAALAAMTDRGYVSKYVRSTQKRREQLAKSLTDLGLICYPSSANFILVNFGSSRDKVCASLRKRGILIRPIADNKVFTGCARITIGSAQEITRLIKELRKIVLSNVLLFDMDGVLVDVSDSLRESIRKTVQYYTKRSITNVQMQALKEKGGYNNDWDLTQKLISDQGVKVNKREVITTFQNYYRGTAKKPGLIQKEHLIIKKSLLKELSKTYLLGIVTGRPRDEAEIALKNFSLEDDFDIVVSMDDYPARLSKPSPYPLTLALKNTSARKVCYFGDSVDDMISARKAKIKPIGIIPPGCESSTLSKNLKKSGAIKVLASINELLEVVS